MPPETLAIVSAMPEELAPLLPRIQGRRKESFSGGTLFSGTLGGRPVVAAVTGDGRGAAERGASALLASTPVRVLLGVGVAAALDPGLALGVVVASSAVTEEDVPRSRLSTLDSRPSTSSPDAALLASAVAAGAVQGRLVTTPRVLVSAAEKRALGRSRDGGYSAADMESISWARAAGARGVPWLVLRAISDRADEELPSFLARCVAPGGGVDRARVARMLLTRPRDLPRLLELKRRVEECAEALAQTVTRLVGGVP